MAGGTPLEDADREPWLHKIRQTAIDLTHSTSEVDTGAQQEESEERKTQRELAEVYETSGHAIQGEERAQSQTNGSLAGADGSIGNGNAIVSNAPSASVPEITRKGHGSEAQRREGCVIACSALKKVYRDLLRGDIVSLDGQPSQHNNELQTVHVYLDVSPEELMRRMEARGATHFMPPALLKTQLAALEAPDPIIERDVIVVKQDGQGDLAHLVKDTAKLVQRYLCTF